MKNNNEELRFPMQRIIVAYRNDVIFRSEINNFHIISKFQQDTKTGEIDFIHELWINFHSNNQELIFEGEYSFCFKYGRHLCSLDLKYEDILTKN